MDTALQFSGGKDSLACLHLYREQWDSLLVCWVNTGAAYPDVVEYMRRWAQRLPHFVEIRSNQPLQIASNGYPSGVVPLDVSPFGRTQVKSGGVRVQSYFHCCAENIWIPMQLELRKRGIRRVIRGQRSDERRNGLMRNGSVHDGIEYVLPLENWNEQQVRDYLQEVGAELPPYYDTERTSRDCWDCTAYLDENAERIRNLPPERRAVVSARLAAIRVEVDREMDLMRGLV